jgi:hypothetical protein
VVTHVRTISFQLQIISVFVAICAANDSVYAMAMAIYYFKIINCVFKIQIVC